MSPAVVPVPSGLRTAAAPQGSLSIVPVLSPEVFGNEVGEDGVRAFGERRAGQDVLSVQSGQQHVGTGRDRSSNGRAT